MKLTEGRVWAEIHLDRLINNYKLIQKRANAATVMAAIKADAYGHGAVEVAHMLENEGSRMFGVASVEEGIELRQAGIGSKILVLSPILYSQIETILEYDLIPTISEMSFFDVLAQKAKACNKPMLVHVEIDSGMTRTGIPYDQAVDAINMIERSPLITIEGLFSHFPLADGDGAFTKKQIREFRQLMRKLREQRINPPYLHLANSSGIFKYRDAHFNLVRPGISLYGLTASPDIRYSNTLAPVMLLKSRVVNVRRVEKNTPVSYGHTYRTNKRSTIATVSIGYGDGYPRALSNRGAVLIRGQRAPIIGTICMDLMMVDATNIRGTAVGDIVTLIGKDGRQEITAEECARLSDTIVYEITSGIGPRVARVFKSHDRVKSVRNLLGRWRYEGH